MVEKSNAFIKQHKTRFPEYETKLNKDLHFALKQLIEGNKHQAILEMYVIIHILHQICCSVHFIFILQTYRNKYPNIQATLEYLNMSQFSFFFF